VNYYFVVTALPPLVLGQKPEMSYEEVRQMLSLNLTERDWEKVVLFQRKMDLRNLHAHWLGQPLDPRGNLGEKELEESLLVESSHLSFVADFLDRYESKEERLRYFASLYASLYQGAEGDSQSPTVFGKSEEGSLDQLEREIRLCLVALRAKVMKRDLSRELQFEDPADPFVAMLLAQKDSNEVVLPKEYEDLKTAFLENRSEPKQLQQAILEFTLSKIEEMPVSEFGMEMILGYLARLLIVEDWAALDEKKGRAAVEKISL
jgi:hypothetical protein